ncbi:MAG: C4-dicarboxylate ABC transporter, partial [Oceanospirillales bacterium]
MDPVLLGEILSLLMFFTIIGVLMMGFPVAFSLAGTSVIFATVGYLLGVFDLSNFSSLAPRYMGVMLNEVLVAVP